MIVVLLDINIFYTPPKGVDVYLYINTTISFYLINTLEKPLNKPNLGRSCGVKDKNSWRY